MSDMEVLEKRIDSEHAYAERCRGRAIVIERIAAAQAKLVEDLTEKSAIKRRAEAEADLLEELADAADKRAAGYRGEIYTDGYASMDETRSDRAHAEAM